MYVCIPREKEELLPQLQKNKKQTNKIYTHTHTHRTRTNTSLVKNKEHAEGGGRGGSGWGIHVTPWLIHVNV